LTHLHRRAVLVVVATGLALAGAVLATPAQADGPPPAPPRALPGPSAPKPEPLTVSWQAAGAQSLAVRPPVALYDDGPGLLRFNAQWLAEAQKRAPRTHGAVELAAAATEGKAGSDLELRAGVGRIHSQDANGSILRIGEVLVLKGDSETVGEDASGRPGVGPQQFQEIARRVIEHSGDVFHTITVWLTFIDTSNNALAFAINVRNEVQGLGQGLPLVDLSGRYGSAGTLRTVVNMKEIGLRAGDRLQDWNEPLAVWGQETGHRFAAFFRTRYRGDNSSDVLLGRDCAHYHRFMHSEASVQDGVAWLDNGDGTFTRQGENLRFGSLDLYSMGLMPTDEMPLMFVIDDIPNTPRVPCSRSRNLRAPRGVSGTRFDISIDDIIAANGPRIPETESGYWREAQVILTAPGEAPTSQTAQALAARIERARIWWEDWAREASDNRLFVCTQTSAGCGDPRSDVAGVTLADPLAVPGAAPVAFVARIANAGGDNPPNAPGRTATGITARMQVEALGRTFTSGPPRPVPDLTTGAEAEVAFEFDLDTIPCGSEASITTWVQSDFHYSRSRTALPLGIQTALQDGFEDTASGWVVDPEGTDTAGTAAWAQGTPQPAQLFGRTVQPAAAQAGSAAFVTGLAESDGVLTRGQSTLRSPLYESQNWIEPKLRFWYWFAGMRTNAGATDVEPGPFSSLSMQARSVVPGADAEAAPTVSAWIEIDRISGQITRSWTERVVSLPAALDLAGQIQLQFVAAEADPQGGGLEVALDEISLTSNLPACREIPMSPGNNSQGGGCQMPAGAPAGGPTLAALLAALFVCGAAARGRRSRKPAQHDRTR